MERFQQKRHESQETKKEEEIMTQEFLSLSLDELQNIRDRIERVQGHVRIAVHPLFIERHPFTFSPGNSGLTAKDMHAALVDGFTKTVNNVVRNEKSSPLFIFEEENFLQETKATVEGLSGSGAEDLIRKGFLFFQTEKYSGRLVGKSASAAYDKVHSVQADQQYDILLAKQQDLLNEASEMYGTHNHDEVWTRKYTEEEMKGVLEKAKKSTAIFAEHHRIEDMIDQRRNAVLRAIFQTLGVRSALISGGYFYDFPNAKQDELKILRGCAGGVTQSLRDNGVLVDISRFSWNSRDSLEEGGHVTKQTGGQSNKSEEKAA